ncbi:MAG TPA: hypothetical protein VFU13_06675 [Steroidobacteraceae bacterium]|nr:hypothetical protein [Steroidobacteraceae bacterium]
MNVKGDRAIEPVAPPTARLWLGVGVFAFGWVLALTLVPFVTGSDLPTSAKATLTTLLVVVCPKIFLIAAIAILGKPGFAYLKGVVMAFFRRVGPPAEVGKWRYRVGLVMFFLPFVLTLLLTYFGPFLPGGREATPAYLKAGDAIQIISLFVLGGDFWDKLRSLFVREAKAVFPPKATAT